MCLLVGNILYAHVYVYVYVYRDVDIGVGVGVGVYIYISASLQTLYNIRIYMLRESISLD